MHGKGKQDGSKMPEARARDKWEHDAGATAGCWPGLDFEQNLPSRSKITIAATGSEPVA
jgi:hypothetical protein